MRSERTLQVFWLNVNFLFEINFKLFVKVAPRASVKCLHVSRSVPAFGKPNCTTISLHLSQCVRVCVCTGVNARLPLLCVRERASKRERENDRAIVSAHRVPQSMKSILPEFSQVTI